MQDVADLVGVSKQTVSAVINHKPGITSETSARVLAAIAQLGYRIDWNARSLRTGRTHTIALFVTDVSSPAPGKMASVAEDCAYAAHYNLILFSTHDEIEREQAYITEAMQRSVDGVLFMSAKDASTGPQRLLDAGIPVVAIARRPRDFSGPSITVDNVEAGRLAGQHLVGLNHSRIAHVSGPRDVHTSTERTAGFMAGLRAGGMSYSLSTVEARSWQIEAGYEGMCSLLMEQSPFSAVFVAGDPLAIGAIHALSEWGLRVSDDVSVVSVDDIDLAGYVNPPLTTVSLAFAQMASAGVHVLLDVVVGKQPPQMHMLIGPTLIVRGSTLPYRSD
jgi:LacI family transcriptional regulator